MDVADILTPEPITIGPDVRPAGALQLMQAEDVRHLPVVDKGTLVGIHSDRDLRAARGAGRPGGTRVVQFMARDPVTITSEARASGAAKRMLCHTFSALPVVQAGALTGMLTLTDLLDHCTETLHERQPKPTRPAGGAGRPRGPAGD